MSSKAIVLDLDNCVADDAWRIPYIAWHEEDPDTRYHVYHALGAYDAAPKLEWLWALIPRDDPEFRVFVLTARSVRYSRATKLWLHDHLPWKVEAVLMRNPGDHRHSAQLKAAQLQSVLNDHDVAGEDLVLAVDDRPEVLAAYHEFGLPNLVTVQHAIHDTCAYTHPAHRNATVPDILRSAATTFEERNKTYGQNYRNVGPAMMALFPDGVELRTADDFTRWHMFELMVVKMTRFANSGLKHEDSIHDACVYAAMVQSFNRGAKGK